MRKSWVQLYAPFIALGLVQALFIAVAPSRGPGAQRVVGTVGAGTPAGEFSAGPTGTIAGSPTGSPSDTTATFDGSSKAATVGSGGG
ncbi:MAG: hypothetical protein C4344_01210, partial [Acidimicrobiia bacterium]